ncbi:hypothetical protein OROMI_022610 [Orobanche minor]
MSTVNALRSIKNSLIDPYQNLRNWKRGDPCTRNWTGVICHNLTPTDGYLHITEFCQDNGEPVMNRPGMVIMTFDSKYQSDNASNCKNAGKRIMEARKSLWWTPCAAHCIDLMLEDIAKLKIFEEAIENAKKVVKFIYGHGTILALMRKHTNDKELLRPAVTRFATAFLTLQSMYKQKRALEVMFSSDEWVTSAQAKKTEGKVAKRIVVNDPNFWPYVAFCVKFVVPLVSVLREVDSEERPAMGYIYELMDRAKETIKWTPQLHHPLHVAGYYLNPQLRYEVGFSNCSEVKEGLYACMDRMLSNDDRLAADIQLDNYDNAQGDFGCPMAIRSRKLRSPGKWWERFGSKTPELTSFAIRVLSLTCSASGCERNWSTFESIHNKKRNRLEHKRLNALVYVKYNLRLRERSIKRRNKIDPIVVDEIDSDDECITEKEDPVLPEKPSWLENDDLFSGDPIVSVPSCPFDSLIDFDKRVEVEVVDGDNGDDDTLPPSPSPPRIPQKRITESSSGSKCKKRRMELIDEDVELEDHGGINPRNFDSGKSATIETIDDDSELELDPTDYVLLSGNQLTGSLPEELGNLSNLNRIQIDENRISGPIPLSFANLSKIRHIHMNNNSLNGPIPPELSGLPILLHLLLDNNNLSGYLPREPSKTQHLLILQLDNNNFNGSTIPSSYGNMTSLLKFLRNCSLHGEIPNWSNMSNDAYIDLSLNQLDGSIATSALSQNITVVDLSDNNMNGTIPGSFSELPRLQKLSLANNLLSGSVPSVIWNFTNIRFSDISGSLLTPLMSLSANYANLLTSMPQQLLICLVFFAAPLYIGYRLKSPGFLDFLPYFDAFKEELSSGLGVNIDPLEVDSAIWQKGPRLKMHLKIFPTYINDSLQLVNDSEVLRIRDLFSGWRIKDNHVFGPFEFLNFTLSDAYKDFLPPSSSGLSKGALAGIILGTIAGSVTLSAFLSLIIVRRRIHKHHQHSQKRLYSLSLAYYVPAASVGNWSQFLVHTMPPKPNNQEINLLREQYESVAAALTEVRIQFAELTAKVAALSPAAHPPPAATALGEGPSEVPIMDEEDMLTTKNPFARSRTTATRNRRHLLSHCTFGHTLRPRLIPAGNMVSAWKSVIFTATKIVLKKRVYT